MSHDFFAGTLAAWTIAYAVVGLFFISANLWARREREYLLFGLVMVALALMSGGMSLLYGGTGGVEGALGGRLAMTGALLASAFQLHFALRYSERARLWNVVVTHVLSAGLVLWAWASGLTIDTTLTEVPDLMLRSEPALDLAFSAACVLAIATSLALLVRAYRNGRREALYLIGSMLIVAVTVLHDVAKILAAESSVVALYIPHVVWVYVVSMSATLLLRYRGTEGRLAETALSLQNRTEELRRSHAELVKVQGELVRKEQLAAVGELAASIAHEVRNPLAVIVNATAGLRRRTLPENDRETLLSIIDEETERLNRLVAELLRFARPVSAKRSAVSLVELCQEVQRNRPPGYDVLVSIPDNPELETIWVDPGLFRLVLDNLVSNACQSMRTGGAVTIDVRDAKFDDGRPAVAIDVADSGHGMEATVLRRATHPFFTTRPSGTGLGLPIVLRIVEAHGGDLRLKSEPGQGTTAILRIPRSASGRGSMPGIDPVPAELLESPSKGSLRAV